jgi:hypothetical protein
MISIQKQQSKVGLLHSKNGDIDAKYIEKVFNPITHTKLYEQKNIVSQTLNDRKEFIRYFNLFTEQQLININWNNVIMAGPCVLSCLLPLVGNNRDVRNIFKNLYKDIDITLFIHDSTKTINPNTLIKELIETITEQLPCDYAIVRSKYSLTIVSQSPYKNIRIITSVFPSVNSILSSFIVECEAVCFDGLNISVLHSSVETLFTRTNVYDVKKTSDLQDLLILRYTKWGFSILVPALKNYDLQLSNCESRTQNGIYKLIECANTSTSDSIFAKSLREYQFKPYLELRNNEKQHNHFDLHLFSNYLDTIKELNKMDKIINFDKSQHNHPYFFGDLDEVFDAQCKCDSVISDVKGSLICNFVNNITNDMMYESDTAQGDSLTNVNLNGEYSNGTLINMQEFYDCADHINKNMDIKQFKEYLIKTNKSILTATDFSGRTLLHLTIQYQKYHLSKYLIRYGSQILQTNNDGFNSIQLALMNGSSSVYTLLLNIYTSSQTIIASAEKENKLIESDSDADDKVHSYDINEANNIYNLSILQLAIMFNDDDDDKLVSEVLKNENIIINNDAISLALQCEKYMVARLLMLRCNTKYFEKKKLCATFIHNVTTDKLNIFLGIFKKNKLEKKEVKKIVTEESESSESSEIDDSSLSDDKETKHKTESEDDVTADVSEEKSKSEQSSGSDLVVDNSDEELDEKNKDMLEDDKSVESDTKKSDSTINKLNVKEYSFDIETLLTEYMFTLCQYTYTDELIKRIHLIEQLGGLYFDPVYNIESEEEHKNIRQPVFAIIHKLMNMSFSDDISRNHYHNGYRLLLHAFKTKADLNWFDVNRQTIYDIVNTSLKNENNDLARLLKNKRTTKSMISKWTNTDKLLVLKQQYVDDLTNTKTDIKQSIKYVSKRIKVYQKILDKIKQCGGITFSNVNIDEWYNTKYIKSIIKSKTSLLASVIKSSPIKYMSPNKMFFQYAKNTNEAQMSDEDIQLYSNIFCKVCNSSSESIKELQQLIDNRVRLDVLMDGLSLMDCAVITKNVIMIDQLIKYCTNYMLAHAEKQAKDIKNDSENVALAFVKNVTNVDNILFWMMSYSKYGNMISLLVNNKLTDVIDTLIQYFPIIYWRQFEHHFEEICYNVMKSDVNYVKLLVVILRIININVQYTGLQSKLLSHKVDTTLNEEHMQSTVSQNDVSIDAVNELLYMINEDEKSIDIINDNESEISIKYNVSNIFEITAKYCKNPDIIQYMFTQYMIDYSLVDKSVVLKTSPSESYMLPINNFLTLFIINQEVSSDSAILECFKIAVKYNTVELENFPLVHLAIHHLKPAFVEILLQFAKEEKLNIKTIDNGYSLEAVSFFTENDEMKKLVPFDMTEVIQVGALPTLYHMSAYFGMNHITDNPVLFTQSDSLGFNIIHYMVMSSQHNLLNNFLTKNKKKDNLSLYFNENIFGMTPIDIARQCYMRKVQETKDNRTTNISDVLKTYNLLDIINTNYGSKSTFERFNVNNINKSMIDLMKTLNNTGHTTQFRQYQ